MAKNVSGFIKIWTACLSSWRILRALEIRMPFRVHSFNLHQDKRILSRNDAMNEHFRPSLIYDATKLIKRAGFTLAEVLIVLGIIGIISEMTIPTLMNNVQDAVLKTSAKKAYSVVSQAWLMAVTNSPDTYTGKGGWSCTWTDGTSGDFNVVDGRTDALKAQLRVIKSCSNAAGCWAASAETAGDYAPCGGNMSLFGWVTADGMYWNNPCYNVDQVHLLVDTNGEKRPNKYGQDIFSMLLGADGAVYFAIDDTSTAGKPVSSGLVCPNSTDPATINGRSVSFRSAVMN